MKVFHEHRSYSADIPLTIWNARNLSFLAHWHTDVEMIFVREGSLRVTINSQTQLLSKGDFAVCCSGDIHYYDSQNMTSTAILLIFDPALVGCPASWPDDSRFHTPFVLAAETQSSELLKALETVLVSIYTEMQAKKPFYDLCATGKVFELCGLVQRHLTASPMDQTSYRRFSSLTTMQEILQYLETHYPDSLTLEDISAHFNLSPAYFCRLFKTITGTNFKSYLNALRVQNAEALLKESQIPITDIAYECGFGSIRTFNRVFKQITGRFPSALR